MDETQPPPFPGPLMFPQGSEMQIKRIPMPDDIRRLEALKIAGNIGAQAAQVSTVSPYVIVDIAKVFEEYLKGDVDNKEVCTDHKPIQHRDGKPPWCRECGLTKDFKEPKSKF